MAEATMLGATSGAIWGSVFCPWTLQHAAQLSLELGFESATLRSLADLLYPLSYSHSRRDHLRVNKKNSPSIFLNRHLGPFVSNFMNLLGSMYSTHDELTYAAINNNYYSKPS